MGYDDSVYLTIVSNASKMNMLADYIEGLPTNFKYGDEIIRFVSFVRNGDKENIVYSFRDLSKLQQLIVVEAFRTLLTTDEWAIFENHMKKKVPELMGKVNGVKNIIEEIDDIIMSY